MNVTATAANEVAVRALAQVVATRLAQAEVPAAGGASSPVVDADSDGTLGTLLDVRA